MSDMKIIQASGREHEMVRTLRHGSPVTVIYEGGDEVAVLGGPLGDACWESEDVVQDFLIERYNAYSRGAREGRAALADDLRRLLNAAPLEMP